MVEAVMEIEPLLADEWTGIPAVAAGLAEAALADPAIDWSFMIETVAVPQPMVEQMLDARSGAIARAALPTLAWEQSRAPPMFGKDAPGLYTNIKPVRRFFAREAMMVYDLSPLLAPEYHDPAAVDWFADHVRGDIETSERLFCISRATRDDVAAYFQVPAERLTVTTPGIAVDPADLSAARFAAGPPGAEPYVVIVGTLEPRKNGRIMLDHLARHPDFAGRYRIVFIGRDGWLDEKARLLEAAARAGVATDRLLFTGFVSEREKLALMMHAAFCIYPSFFEGYGLPVLEAAALGRLTVCSDRTSLPEVAPDACLFFDPHDPESFALVLDEAERLVPAPLLSLADQQAALERVSPARCYPPIARWVLDG